MTTYDNMKHDHSHDDAGRQWADAKLEAWLDGDLSAIDGARFEKLLASDEWLQNESDLARSISDTFASMDDVRCPDDVTAQIMTHVRRDWVMQLPRRLKDGFGRMASAGLRPALAMMLLLVVVISSTWISRNPAVPTGQDAEVAQALEDVKMALAVLADAGRTTGTTVSNEVIGPYVVRPMAKGMNSVIEN